jgi:hypothetical protein
MAASRTTRRILPAAPLRADVSIMIYCYDFPAKSDARRIAACCFGYILGATIRGRRSVIGDLLACQDARRVQTRCNHLDFFECSRFTYSRFALRNI